MDNIVDPFPIPSDWLRIFGFDKGWSDATCLCCGAIDPNSGICYIYDEYYETQKAITFHARRIKEMVDGVRMYKGIQADPSVRNRNDRDGVSYQQYFYQVSGIWLEEGNNVIMDGIDRVRDFMYMGKLKFFTNCVNLKEEAGNYVWKVNKDGIQEDIPVDRNNHLMDALRYLCMGLPLDFKECYMTYKNVSLKGKDTILSRIKPDTDISDIIGECEGGAYGIGMFNMD